MHSILKCYNLTLWGGRYYRWSQLWLVVCQVHKIRRQVFFFSLKKSRTAAGYAGKDTFHQNQVPRFTIFNYLPCVGILSTWKWKAELCLSADMEVPDWGFYLVFSKAGLQIIFFYFNFLSHRWDLMSITGKKNIPEALAFPLVFPLWRFHIRWGCSKHAGEYITRRWQKWGVLISLKGWGMTNWENGVNWMT